MPTRLSTMAKKSQEAAHRENAQQQAARQRQPYDYGGNPLAHIHTSDSARLPAFGGAAQPGLYKPPDTQIANPAPLGLAGFALTTFILSCVNLGVRGLASPAIVVAPALAYGGFIQLLAGMWEIAVGELKPETLTVYSPADELTNSFFVQAMYSVAQLSLRTVASG
jgi:hypothetical protein